MSTTVPPSRQHLGRTLGDFVLQRELDEGGFGAVYLANQKALGREAVVKVLHTHLSGSDSAVQRFLREAQLASSLDHPYAAHVYAFGAEPDGTLWIAMELVRGTPLDELLRIQGPMPLERLVPLFDRICEVVHTAHEQGIIHRDLKPANVMVLSRAGRQLPKLLDFGIARALGESPLVEGALAPPVPQSTGRVGSPLYMAPEQWVNAPTDRRTDVYALGILVYETLTGKPPFAGSTVMEVAAAHAESAVPSLGPGFPPEVDPVLKKALEKKPADRYSDALAFAAALRAAAGLEEQPALPHLDPDIRIRATLSLPQPIAEAVVALEAARNAYQARDELWQLVGTAAQYLGLLALACRTRIGLGKTGEHRGIVDALRALRSNGFDERQWIDLARELCRPFADRCDAFPIPEIVRFFFDASGAARGNAFEPLLAEAENERGRDLSEDLSRWMSLVSRLLAGLEFLVDYPLVVRRGDRIERWMGTRRPHRLAVPIVGVGWPDGQPGIVDSDGCSVLTLAPLFQVAPPTPGAAEEVFMLAGPGRHGARLVARPSRFLRHDDTLWNWFRRVLTDADKDAPSQTDEERSPYRGLSFFTRDDAELFFGREQDTSALLNRMRMVPLVAVVGASGAGKSSFIHAGVLPALPTGWRSIVVRPGAAPLSTLAARLQSMGIAVPPDLSADPDALGRALVAAAPPGQTIILVVDQFEELFTLCRDPAERAAYAAALACAVRSSDEPIRIMLALRDDFLMRAQQLGGLGDRLPPGLQLLATPAAADLVRILVEPAKLSGYEFEDANLPNEMVAAVAEQPGALALLSFTASRLWELRDRHFKRLPRGAYDALGGVGGALAQHAEATLAGMSIDEQKRVRDAFRHLTTSENTRGVLLRSDLRRFLGDDARADGVIERLVGARLLVASEADGGVDQIEIVHEALLSAWPRLIEWRRDDAEGLRLRDQLRSAARHWEQRGRARGLLWRDDALTEYKLWRTRNPGLTGAVEEQFAAASLAEAARVVKLRRRVLTSAFFALAAVVIVLLKINQRAVMASHEAAARLAGLHEEQGRQLLVSGDPVRALVYLTEATREGRRGPAMQWMLARAWGQLASERAVLRGHRDRVNWAEFDPSGKRVVTASSDGTARVWDRYTGRQLLVLDAGGPAWSARYVANGARILTGAENGIARLFDAQTGERLGELVFTKDHRQIASGTAAVGQFAALRTTLVLDSEFDRCWTVRFFPDGVRVFAAGERDLVVRDAVTGRALVSLPTSANPIGFAGVSDDWSRLATSADDGHVRIWDLRTGRLISTVSAPPLSTLAFDRRGTRLFTAQQDRLLRAWDTSTGRLLRSYEGHTGAVTSATLSADQRALVSTSRDSTARVWDVETGRSITVLRGHLDMLWAASFSSEGDVVTASFDRTGRVWSPNTEQVSLSSETANASAFIDGGSRLVTTGKRVTVWDVVGSRMERQVNESGIGYPSRDGSRISVCNETDTVRVYDGQNGHLIAALRAPGTIVYEASFSPDATLLVTAESQGAARVWDVVHQRVLFPLVGHQLRVTSASFSPDGAHLVTTSYDETARLWDARTGNELMVLRGHNQYLMSAWFSHDGRRIITASGDKTARVWETATGHQLAELHHPDFVWTAHLSSDDALAVTTVGDGTTRIWDVASERLLTVLEHPGSSWSDFSPDGRWGVSLGESGIQLWSATRDMRSPDAIQEAARCRLPFRLAGDHIVPATVEPELCSKVGQ